MITNCNSPSIDPIAWDGNVMWSHIAHVIVQDEHNKSNFTPFKLLLVRMPGWYNLSIGLFVYHLLNNKHCPCHVFITLYQNKSLTKKWSCCYSYTFYHIMLRIIALACRGSGDSYLWIVLAAERHGLSDRNWDTGYDCNWEIPWVWLCGGNSQSSIDVSAIL